jgi:Flp pilus assembly protein TadD
MIRILFLGVNPRDTERLRLGEEARMIKSKLRSSEHRESFQIEVEFAVRVGDIQEHLLRHIPHIVHFAGHGSSAGEIVLEDSAGNSQPVPPLALRELFTVLKDNIRCVVLNACFSRIQAEAIAETIDCVVGMSGKIGDEAAIAFAASFYQGLGYGRSLQTSFQLGCSQIDLASLGGATTPELLVRPAVDPADVFLLGHPGKLDLAGSGLERDPLEQAVELDAEGKTTEAIRLLETAAREEPGRALTHFNLGVLYQKLGQRDQALSQYRRATELEDLSGDAYFNIGLLCHEAGVLEEAVQALSMALQINPRHTEAMKALGIIEDNQGNTHSAIQWFHKALEVHPQDGQALNGLAETLKNAGFLEDAMDQIRRARKLEPFNQTFQTTEQEIEQALEGS